MATGGVTSWSGSWMRRSSSFVSVASSVGTSALLQHTSRSKIAKRSFTSGSSGSVWHRKSSSDVIRNSTQFDFSPLERFLWGDSTPRKLPLPAKPLELDETQLAALLSTTDERVASSMHEYAKRVTDAIFGDKVWFRGIVEFSNVCEKSCHYCGIGRGVSKVKRYTIPKNEIVDCALFAHNLKMGTVMLQSGEISHQARISWLSDVVKEIVSQTSQSDPEGRAIRVALSVGELALPQYKQLYDAGARRYLLRIESSNPDLYSKMHPQDGSHTWDKRRQCLNNLAEAGFQLGTGVLIGVPGQRYLDLARDLLFFREIEADMIGMGPYIVEKDTPMGMLWASLHSGETEEQIVAYKKWLFELSTRMVSLARILLGNVNIASTTALDTLNPIGRIITLNRGANILMPILTPTKYREQYQLYQGKPSIHENAEESRQKMIARVLAAGKQLATDPGDPPHFAQKTSKSKH